MVHPMTVKTLSPTSSDLVSSSLLSSSWPRCCSWFWSLRLWFTVSCRSSSSSAAVRSLWSRAVSSALNSSSCSKCSTSSVRTAQRGSDYNRSYEDKINVEYEMVYPCESVDVLALFPVDWLVAHPVFPVISDERLGRGDNGAGWRQGFLLMSDSSGSSEALV